MLVLSTLVLLMHMTKIWMKVESRQRPKGHMTSLAKRGLTRVHFALIVLSRPRTKARQFLGPSGGMEKSIISTDFLLLRTTTTQSHSLGHGPEVDGNRSGTK